MYYEHYQLKLGPFDNSPDPRFFFASEDHTEAMAAIEYTVRMRKGMVLVSGGIGTGKTTISQTIKTRLSDAVDAITLHQGIDTPIQLIKQLCRSLNVVVGSNDDRSDLLAGLQDQLLARQGSGKPVVVIVDEAQAMSIEVLDEIRLLSNIETTTDKLLQFILIGQPEIRTILQRQELAPLRQRIVLAHHLSALSLKDVKAYVNHRIRVAGDGNMVKLTVTDSAYAVIYEYTRGIPRLINCLMDGALLIGYARGTHEIHDGIVKTVIRKMLPTPYVDPVETQPKVTINNEFASRAA